MGWEVRGGWGGEGAEGVGECCRTGAAAMNVGRGTEPHLRNLPVVVYGWMLTVRVCRRQSVCYAGGDASGSIVAAGTTVRPLAEACIKKQNNNIRLKTPFPLKQYSCVCMCVCVCVGGGGGGARSRGCTF